MLELCSVQARRVAWNPLIDDTCIKLNSVQKLRSLTSYRRVESTLVHIEILWWTWVGWAVWNLWSMNLGRWIWHCGILLLLGWRNVTKVSFLTFHIMIHRAIYPSHKIAIHTNSASTSLNDNADTRSSHRVTDVDMPSNVRWGVDLLKLFGVLNPIFGGQGELHIVCSSEVTSALTCDREVPHNCHGIETFYWSCTRVQRRR